MEALPTGRATVPANGGRSTSRSKQAGRRVYTWDATGRTHRPRWRSWGNSWCGLCVVAEEPGYDVFSFQEVRQCRPFASEAGGQASADRRRRAGSPLELGGVGGVRARQASVGRRVRPLGAGGRWRASVGVVQGSSCCGARFGRCLVRRGSSLLPILSGSCAQACSHDETRVAKLLFKSLARRVADARVSNTGVRVQSSSRASRFRRLWNHSEADGSARRLR